VKLIQGIGASKMGILSVYQTYAYELRNVGTSNRKSLSKEMGVCNIHSHSRFLQFVNSHDLDMGNIGLGRFKTRQSKALLIEMIDGAFVLCDLLLQSRGKT
jgi:hypothetical protein